MTIHKLERVLWRLRRRCPGNRYPSNLELHRAIMHEIGTDKLTYERNRQALIKLGWIQTNGNRRVYLTNEDVGDGDF